MPAAVPRPLPVRQSYASAQRPRRPVRRRPPPCAALARPLSPLEALPADLLLLISDFLHASALPAVSRRLGAALAGCHLAFYLQTSNPSASLPNLQHCLPRLRTLHLWLEGLGLPPEALAPLAGWRRALALHTLALDLRGCCLTGLCRPLWHSLGDATALHTVVLSVRDLQLGTGLGAEALEDVVAVRRLPALTNLTLDVAMNHLRPGQTAPLAALRECPRLERLALFLKANHLGDTDVDALAELHRAPALQTLTLDLASNRLLPGEVASLAALAKSATLQSLELWLPYNCISGLDLRALTFTSLSRLDLDFHSNPLGLGSLRAIRDLAQAPHLHTLRLGLASCGLGASDAPHLAALQHSRTLTHLRLDLERNRLGAAGPAAVAALAGLPALRRLEANLGRLELRPGDAVPLAALRHASSLHSLSLQLYRNSLGREDVAALADLRRSATLQFLSLDLQSTDLAGPDVLPFAALAEEGVALAAVVLDVRGTPLFPAERAALQGLRDMPQPPGVTVWMDEAQSEEPPPVEVQWRPLPVPVLVPQPPPLPSPALPWGRRRRRSRKPPDRPPAIGSRTPQPVPADLCSRRRAPSSSAPTRRTHCATPPQRATSRGPPGRPRPPPRPGRRGPHSSAPAARSASPPRGSGPRGSGGGGQRHRSAPAKTRSDRPAKTWPSTGPPARATHAALSRGSPAVTAAAAAAQRRAAERLGRWLRHAKQGARPGPTGRTATAARPPLKVLETCTAGRSRVLPRHTRWQTATIPA